MLRTIIITQEDNFAIPRNIEKLVSLPEVQVLKIVSLNSRGALINKKGYFLKGFGMFQGAKMALKLAARKSLAAVDNFFKGDLLLQKHSVKSVARQNNITYEVCDDPNDKTFVDSLRLLNPDIIVSFSAPLVFKPLLLGLPRLGCINLHCSYLPEFAGLLPSFWALYTEAAETGATVHYMDDRIDNGGILDQVRVPIEKNQSMYQLILQTKLAGGDLVCDVIKKLAHGVELNPRPNPAREDCYYSWPTVEQMIEFRRMGKRFV